MSEVVKFPEKRDTYFVVFHYDDGENFQFRINPGDFDKLKLDLINKESFFVEFKSIDGSWIWLTCDGIRLVRFYKNKENKPNQDG